MEREEFTLFDILKATKIPRERLRAWMKEGYIKPSIQTATGPGRAADSKNLFSRLDLYRVTLFWYMVEKLNLKRYEAAKIVNSWFNDISYWTELAGVDDKRLRNLLKKCNVITVYKYQIDDGAYHLEAPEFLAEIEDKVLADYEKQLNKPGHKLPPKSRAFKSFGHMMDSSHKSKCKILMEQLTNSDLVPNWSWVQHINFAKIREAVEQLFP